ncbi:hypothetical protein BDR04DRAFT_950721, partial [Suillus decipiens]
KSTILVKSFFLSPPADNLLPPDIIYPDPVTHHTPFSQDKITCAITKLNSYKALGPDGICNIVYKCCTNILVPYLTHLFNAAFTHHMFYEPWKCFTTVILQKPGKSNYTVPEAYCPITLLNTLRKLLSAVIADHLTFTLEHYQLLSNTHFWG